jgi:hypothetical protein
MKYVRMKIENSLIEEAHYEAWIHYYSDDKGQKIRAIINEIDGNRTFQEQIVEEFDTIEEATSFLEKTCKSLILEELTNVSRRGRWAQEKIDSINNQGFML